MQKVISHLKFHSVHLTAYGECVKVMSYGVESKQIDLIFLI